MMGNRVCCKREQIFFYPRKKNWTELSGKRAVYSIFWSDVLIRGFVAQLCTILDSIHIYPSSKRIPSNWLRPKVMSHAAPPLSQTQNYGISDFMWFEPSPLFSAKLCIVVFMQGERKNFFVPTLKGEILLRDQQLFGGRGNFLGKVYPLRFVVK